MTIHVMQTQSEENYLKTIFALQSKEGKSINTNAIATKMNTKASSVSDMIKRLSEKGLVNYIKYQGVNLTPQGKEIALNIIRKHRLWETFLVDKLSFSWDEVHDVAEQLEHVKSLELVNRLDAFLEYPEQDPHGDPIPDEDGKMRIENSFILSDATMNTTYKISGIKDSSTSFLVYLDNLKLTINSEIEVLTKSSFDNSFLIQFNNQTLSLSKKVCDNLYIKKI